MGGTITMAMSRLNVNSVLVLTIGKSTVVLRELGIVDWNIKHSIL